MTSSGKPEVQNILQHHQGRTEPWPQATCTKDLQKFRCAVFDLCEWTHTHRLTDKQTSTQTDILITILHTNPSHKQHEHDMHFTYSHDATRENH